MSGPERGTAGSGSAAGSGAGPNAEAGALTAAILAVGSELLGTVRLDTNSLTLAAILERYGVELRRKEVVGDDEGELAASLARLAAGFDLVLVTGGLGPTADDVTRAAAAAAFDRALRHDRDVEANIAAAFARMDLEMPAVNRRQAQVLDGAEVLANRRGTAPGLQLLAGRATVFLLPGVPTELAGMVSAYLEPWLATRSGGPQRETLVLKVACMPESVLEEKIAPVYDELGREAITVLAKPGDIEVRVTLAGDPADRRRRLATISERLRHLIGRAVYGEGEDVSLEAVVGELLRRRGRTVVTAESCTGGLVAERLTRVAGSSAYFQGAVVAYSNPLKSALLGVPEELLVEPGAVSEAVALAMARGARQTLGSDYAIAVTGIAGPDGGSEAKPVGTVHLAVAGGGEPVHRRVVLPGDRQRIRQLASQVGLELLRRTVLAGEGGS